VSNAALSGALALCLGAGAVDLLALNLVVLPAARGPMPSPIEPEVPPRAHAPAIAKRDTHPELAALFPVPVAAQPAPRAEPLPVAVLEFDVASRRVDRRGATSMSQTLRQLRDASEIIVIGHADASGPEQLNDRLSAQRAAAVARRLVEGGILETRVRVDARGEREPRKEGNSRRVEIFVGGQS
jgi:OOP family OmpA-OmpF porin